MSGCGLGHEPQIFTQKKALAQVSSASLRNMAHGRYIHSKTSSKWPIVVKELKRPVSLVCFFKSSVTDVVS